MNKRMKKTRKSRGGSGSSNVSIINDDDVILCEILSRLPAKSLMRFKCVCKRWQSLIQHNPYFNDLHSTRSVTRPSLLFASFIQQGKRFIGQSLWSADLFEKRAEVHTKLYFSSPHYCIEGLINGLICLLHRKHLAVCIYNLSTRQMTPWIKRTINKKELEEEHGVEVRHEDSTYQFGHDPATKGLKVICLSRILKIKTLREGELISAVTVCVVLTVGHDSWRRINEVPPYDFERVFVYANGSIHWKKVSFRKEPEVIVAFDVGPEKFRVILVPDFILHQPPKCDVLFGRCSDLLEVDGHVALLHRMSGYTVKLWIFDDDHKEEKISTSNNWHEETHITFLLETVLGCLFSSCCRDRPNYHAI